MSTIVALIAGFLVGTFFGFMLLAVLIAGDDKWQRKKHLEK